MAIVLQYLTIAIAVMVFILLGIEIGKGIKFIKSIDKNKIREEKAKKERDSLEALIQSAQKKIDELDKKKR